MLRIVKVMYSVVYKFLSDIAEFPQQSWMANKTRSSANAKIPRRT